METASFVDIDTLINLLVYLEYPSPRPSVTKTATWQYLGNQAWYHRMAQPALQVFWGCLEGIQKIF